MKIRIKKLPQQPEMNARKWKHADGGHLYEDGGVINPYNEPQTFIGRIAQVIGSSPSVVRGADVVSSAVQMTPYGNYIAAMDLGRDLNRAYHNEDGAWWDSALDVASMLPFLRQSGLKAGKTLFNTIRNNKSLRRAINAGIGLGKAIDFNNDTYGANKASKAEGGYLHGPVVEAALEHQYGPGGTITYGAPHYLYDENGQIVRDENGKPYINYNATLSDIVITPEEGILNKGMNYSSNPTVGYAARKAGEDAVREKQEKAAELAERFNRQNEMHSLFPTKDVSGETVFESKDGPKVIGMSGADPIGEAIVMGEALSPFLKAVPGVYRAGRRFIQNVGDRYQGMLDAADYAANKEIDMESAADITNFLWLNRQGPTASGDRMLALTKGRSGYKDSQGNIRLTSSPEGKQTIDVHLGGEHYGDKPWELKPMELSKRKWLNEYLESAPRGTMFGEVGSTKNFAEQYTDINPSITRALKDAMLNKTETSEMWPRYEAGVQQELAKTTDPTISAYYSNLLNGNSPLSVDSYKMMLDMARKRKYGLRYDSKPMGLFNSQGFYQKDFYESLQPLAPEKQVDAINSWIKGINPDARPAYLSNGEVLIPRPLLKKLTPSRKTWLRKRQ